MNDERTFLRIEINIHYLTYKRRLPHPKSKMIGHFYFLLDKRHALYYDISCDCNL